MGRAPGAGCAGAVQLEHLRVKSGDRIAIIGRNGCGKSSLLRLLWQAYQHPAERPAIFHPRVRIGYYDQSLQQLRDEDTLSEALAQFAPLTEEQRKMALIGAGFLTCATISRSVR